MILKWNLYKLVNLVPEFTLHNGARVKVVAELEELWDVVSDGDED